MIIVDYNNAFLRDSTLEVKKPYQRDYVLLQP